MLRDITRHLDELLDHARVADYPGALNGLQLENSGRVEHHRRWCRSFSLITSQPAHLTGLANPPASVRIQPNST